MIGTMKSVAKVATSKPPITALPNGAFCSPPSPKPSAMGNMPMIIASAVIITGRMRVKPADRAASTSFLPALRSSLAVDIGKNVGRHGDDRRPAEEGDQDCHHNKGVPAP